MAKNRVSTRGFTLIASLMLLLILSGVAIGLLMMVNTEGKVNSQDVQNNLAFHAAEGGIEHMTSDLANMFQNIESPTASQIQALSSLAPANSPLMSYPVYTLTPTTNPDGSLATSFGQVASGVYAGLYAQILNVGLNVTAQGPLGDEVNMSRTVEVALIPVFQFGVFSDSDLSFFAGPNFGFAGRVHTNGDLYLAEGAGSTLTFQDKLTSFGNVIRTQLANGQPLAANNSTGTVVIPQAPNGCTGGPPLPNCRAMATTEGSVVGAGGNPPQSPYNWGPPTWQNISQNTYQGFIRDGDYGNPNFGTGVTNLSLPFVNGTSNGNAGPQSYEIIRRPPAGELASSPLGSSRLYNEAEIRVLITDTPAELPGGVGDAENVRLANVGNYVNGVPTSVQGGLPALGAGQAYTTYFAMGSTAVPDQAAYNPASNFIAADWLYQPLAPPAGFVTLFDANAPIMTAGNAGLTAAPATPALTTCNMGTNPPTCPGLAVPYYNTAGYPYYTPLAYPAVPVTVPTTSTWNLLDGYIRVEYRDVNGAYHPVTNEWLKLGFARGTVPPTVAGGNPVNPNAILVFQEPADRNGDGLIDMRGAPPGPTANCVRVAGVWTCPPGKPPEVTTDVNSTSPWYGINPPPAGFSSTAYNWYPINFYDTREGEIRDTATGNSTCTPNGVMNAVELDVGNLKNWLNGNIAGSGNLVDYQFQNGYVLYFSDRRGMLPNPNGTQVDAAGTKTGDSGLEDSMNAAIANGKPNGTLDPIPVGKNASPEDANLNGTLENFGAENLGLGLGYIGGAYVAGNSVNRKVINAAGAPDPYVTAGRIPNCNVAQNGWVSGARHVLKLVDGTIGNLPLRPDNNQGGFTVGSENPVYIYGDYNSNAADLTFNTPPGADPANMAAAGIVADSVTMLSNGWSDLRSILLQPTTLGNRPAQTTYYRVAIAGGKNMNFPFPAWAGGVAGADFGTDGGVHNFLRYIENWGGQTLNYKGSIVSLYYSTYATGVYKCCTVVYSPPARNYFFDDDFKNPAGLPPGTPLFRDIDNLSYRQTFTPCTTQANGVCTN